MKGTATRAVTPGLTFPGWIADHARERYLIAMLGKDAHRAAQVWAARGISRIYHLREQGMRAVQAYLEGIWGEAAARFRLLTENTEEAVGTVSTAFRMSFDIACSVQQSTRSRVSCVFSRPGNSALFGKYRIGLGEKWQSSVALPTAGRVVLSKDAL